MKKFFKGLFYFFLYLLACCITACLIPNSEIGGLVLFLEFIALVFYLLIRLIIWDWRRMSPEKQAEQKEVLKILGVTLLCMAILIPFIIFVVYPYVISPLIDFITYLLFKPTIIIYT